MELEPPKPIKPRVKHVGVSVELDVAPSPSKEQFVFEKPKTPSRAISTNTDRLRTISVGCNTLVFIFFHSLLMR